MTISAWRRGTGAADEPHDPSIRRFCPRCNTVTVWDTPGDLTYLCTTPAATEHGFCGFTYTDALTDREAANAEAFNDRHAPRPAGTYRWV